MRDLPPPTLRCDVGGCSDEIAVRVGQEQRCFAHALERAATERHTRMLRERAARRRERRVRIVRALASWWGEWCLIILTVLAAPAYAALAMGWDWLFGGLVLAYLATHAAAGAVRLWFCTWEAEP